MKNETVRKTVLGPTVHTVETVKYVTTVWGPDDHWDVYNGVNGESAWRAHSAAISTLVGALKLTAGSDLQ